MKKQFFSWIGITLISMVCVCFASCDSDDDNNNKGNNSNSLIVGTWQDTNSGTSQDKKGKYKFNNTFTYNFKSDGKYTYTIFTVEYYVDLKNTEESELSITGTYSYNELTKTLSLVANDGTSDSYTVLNLSYDILTLLSRGGGTYTYKKIYN